MTKNFIKNYDLFVSCSPGLEELLAEELISLGFEKAVPGYRGAYIFCDKLFEAIYRINYCSRLATRVLLPLARFHCDNQQDLYQGALEIEWHEFIPPNKTIAIDANVTHPHIKNSLYAAQLVKDAICDSLKASRGNRPSVNITEPDVQLSLFIHDFAATISFDTSGLALHKRGYRQLSGEAPLQEVLAASVLMQGKWNKEEPLCDLFCGTGTFLTEAALMASNTAPGFLRQRFGFMLLPGYSLAAWLKVKNEVDSIRKPLPKDLLTGIDINEKALKASYANLRACGFAGKVSLLHHSFADFIPSSPVHFIVANPPHGDRLGEEEELLPLYQQLGQWLRQHVARPGKAAILLSNLNLAKALTLGAGKKHKLISGGDTKFLCCYEFLQKREADLESLA